MPTYFITAFFYNPNWFGFTCQNIRNLISL